MKANGKMDCLMVRVKFIIKEESFTKEISKVVEGKDSDFINVTIILTKGNGLMGKWKVMGN